MMHAEQQPVLGILGGMGPLATVDFLGKLTRSLPAQHDQDHLPWITISQPGMPDRSRAIQNQDHGPRPYLLKGVAWLAAQGVQLIAIPCSTSHYWFESMQAASGVPILHIADATIEELTLDGRQAPGQVAVLATRGTIGSGIYSRRLQAAGLAQTGLDESQQMAVDRMIHDVKSGNLDSARGTMRELQGSLADSGATAVVLACTELPLAHDATAAGLPVIDVSLALAKASLRRLGYLI